MATRYPSHSLINSLTLSLSDPAYLTHIQHTMSPVASPLSTSNKRPVDDVQGSKGGKKLKSASEGEVVKTAYRKRIETLACLRIAEAMLVRIWNVRNKQANRCLELAGSLSLLAIDIHKAEDVDFLYPDKHSEEEAKAAIDAITDAAMKAISDALADGEGSAGAHLNLPEIHSDALGTAFAELVGCSAFESNPLRLAVLEICKKWC
jgi:hypothetical protein